MAFIGQELGGFSCCFVGDDGCILAVKWVLILDFILDRWRIIFLASKSS